MTWRKKLRALLCQVFPHKFGQVVPGEPEWVLVSLHKIGGDVSRERRYGYYGRETCLRCGHSREHFHFLPNPKTWSDKLERMRLN